MHFMIILSLGRTHVTSKTLFIAIFDDFCAALPLSIYIVLII